MLLQVEGHFLDVSGGSDGSILLWEWGIEQPLCTARHAGQYAKVSQLAFAQNSNKFAAVDGDGMLCIWKASQQTASIKPFFVSILFEILNLLNFLKK